MSSSGVPIADLAAAIKRRNPALAGVDDATLVRKVLERRPELMSILQRSEPRPPMKGLYEKIGDRMEQNFNLPKQAQDYANAVSAALNDPRAKTGGRIPEMFQAIKSTYSQPGNVIGDLLTAGIMGMAGETGAPKTSATPAEIQRFPALAESDVDMATRRGPGEPPPAAPVSPLQQQYALIDKLKARYAQLRATGDPQMFQVGSQLRDTMDAIKKLETEKWGPGAKTSPQTLSSKGGGGLNYTADDLAALKKKWNIQ